MFDKELVVSTLTQISEAIDKIKSRTDNIKSSSDFTDSAWGMEKLDSICMLFIVIGESLKNIDKITDGNLLRKYSGVNWSGVKKFRDIVAHHYFDIDAEQIFWIITNELENIHDAIKKIIQDLS